MTNLYVMTTREPVPEVKIGVSGNPRRRLKELNTSRVELLRFHSAIQCCNQSNALMTERILHGLFRECRKRGEIFSVDPRIATLAALGLRYVSLPATMRPFEIYLSAEAQQFPEQFELPFPNALDMVPQPDGSYSVIA